MKRNLSALTIIKISTAVALIVLAAYVNLIAVNRLGFYAIEVDFYNKLSVAYDIGGIEGLKSTLNKIKIHDKSRHELVVAADFEKKLNALDDPKNFIDNALSQENKKIRLIINLRRVAIALILVIFLLRIFVNIQSLKAKKA
ncbi:MAG: hypothetical protein WC394_00905 [Candidatus Omnitrophota bacterium]